MEERDTTVIAGRVPNHTIPLIEKYLKKHQLSRAKLVEQAVLSLVLYAKPVGISRIPQSKEE